MSWGSERMDEGSDAEMARASKHSERNVRQCEKLTGSMFLQASFWKPVSAMEKDYTGMSGPSSSIGDHVKKTSGRQLMRALYS